MVGALGALAAVAAVTLPATATAAHPTTSVAALDATPVRRTTDGRTGRSVVPPDTSGDENGVAPSELPASSLPSDDTRTTDLGTTDRTAPQRPSVLDESAGRSAPLVVVPAGCPAADLPTAVFVGDLATRDFRTAQFTIRSVRAGSVAAWSAGDQVQVRYGDDVRFLEVGGTYIVGTQRDPANGSLTSKVRAPAPLFGGDAVLGVDDKDVTCPTLEDPVMTLTAAATPIDSGLLTPLRHAKADVLLAVVRPFVVALAVLLALVMVKQLLFAGGRSLRASTVTERPRPTSAKVRRTRVLRTSRRRRPHRLPGETETSSAQVPTGPNETGTAERVIVVGQPGGGVSS